MRLSTLPPVYHNLSLCANSEVNKPRLGLLHLPCQPLTISFSPQVVRAIMSDAWLLSVELEGGGERSGPANKDRWPVRVGCLQLCSWDEGGEPACKATTIVEP